MKELPLLTATTPISASVEDAAATQVHYTVIIITFVSLTVLFFFSSMCPFPVIFSLPRQEGTIF